MVQSFLLTKAAVGLTNQDMLMVAQAQSRPPGQTRLIPKKGQPFYDSWKAREQHMGVYNEIDGKAAVIGARILHGAASRGTY